MPNCPPNNCYPCFPCEPCHNPEFIAMVRDAVSDELGAVAIYTQMANMVDNLALKALLTGIAGDEYGHARTWMTILALCGFCS